MADFEDKSFAEFLKSKRLTDTVRHYVQRAIAMVPDTASTLEVRNGTRYYCCCSTVKFRHDLSYCSTVKVRID